MLGEKVCVSWSNEVLRSLVLADRKPGHARSGRRDRIELRSVNDRVAEVENVGRREVMIYLHASLVRILSHHLGRGKHIGSRVGERNVLQEILRNRIGLGIDGILVVGIGLAEENVEQLVILVVAKACREPFRAKRREVTISLCN